MKNTLILGILASLVLFTILLTSCGQSNSTTTTTITTTTLAPGATVSISGSLKSGTVAASGIAIKSSGVKTLARAFGAISSNTIVAVSASSGKVYFPSSATDASGNFTIAGLPATESYYLEILDSNNDLAAPVAFGTLSGKAVMAIDPNQANVALGEIAYDSSKNAAAPVTEPTTNLDTSITVTPKSGQTLVPLGAGNLGKGSGTEIVSGSYDSTKVDGDKDGLPNFLDADNNGDLVPDEFDGLYTSEVLSPGTRNYDLYVFSNLKVDFDNRNTFQTNYSELTLAIGLTSNTSGTKTVSSVKVLSGPSWISKANIINGGGLWSATSYNVPLKSSSPKVFEVQVNGLKPLTDVNAGDALKFEITYTDGTTETALKMLNFIFTDIPRATAYKLGSSGSWQTISLTATGRLTIATTTEVYLRWTRPKDESGAEICGAKYTFEYNVIGGGAAEAIIITKDADSTLTSLEGGCVFAAQPNADLTNDLLCGLCVRSIASDNSAENMWFTKGW